MSCVGATISTTFGVVKSSLAGAVLLELTVAKTIDLQLTKHLRRPDSPATRFYTGMARAGLEAGWKNNGKALPWWYGALSYGATGCMDFFTGQALGCQLREVFDAHPDVRARQKHGCGQKLTTLWRSVSAATQGCKRNLIRLRRKWWPDNCRQPPRHNNYSTCFSRILA